MEEWTPGYVRLRRDGYWGSSNRRTYCWGMDYPAVSESHALSIARPKDLKTKETTLWSLEFFCEEITMPRINLCIETLNLTEDLSPNELIIKNIPKSGSQAAMRRTKRKVTGFLRVNLQAHQRLQKEDRFLLMDVRDPTSFVMHWNEFCTNYLSNLEPQTHQGIQPRWWKHWWKRSQRTVFRQHSRSRMHLQWTDCRQTNDWVPHWWIWFTPFWCRRNGLLFVWGNLYDKLPSNEQLLMFSQDESVFNEFLSNHANGLGRKQVTNNNFYLRPMV